MGQWTTRKPFAIKVDPGTEGMLVNFVDNIAGQNPPTTRDLWCGEHQEAYVKTEAN